MDDKEYQQKANDWYSLLFDKDMRKLIEKATENIEAEEELNGHLLSMDLLRTNHRDKTYVWELLLGTGGPASRVLVTAKFNGEVIDADYQYQDWFKPWISAENQDKELLIDFASSLQVTYENAK